MGYDSQINGSISTEYDDDDDDDDDGAQAQN